MIYIKEYNTYNDDIDAICKKYGIKRYTINNGMVDVDGDVNLSDRDLDKLPLKFGIVTGYFYCQWNKLTSLEGSPKEVGGYFYCHYNKLKSLQGGPKIVVGSFDCSDNQLISLEGGPKEVGGGFYCYSNKLSSLKGAPRKFGEIFSCHRNNNLPEIFNKYINDKSYWKEILKWQEYYSIWRNDGSLDEYRFKELIKDIEDNDIH